MGIDRKNNRNQISSGVSFETKLIMHRCVDCITNFKTKVVTKKNFRRLTDFSRNNRIAKFLLHHKRVRVFYCKLGRTDEQVYVVPDWVPMNKLIKWGGFYRLFNKLNKKSIILTSTILKLPACPLFNKDLDKPTDDDFVDKLEEIMEKEENINKELRLKK